MPNKVFQGKAISGYVPPPNPPLFMDRPPIQVVRDVSIKSNGQTQLAMNMILILFFHPKGTWTQKTLR